MARVLQIVTEMALGGATLTMLDFVEDLAPNTRSTSPTVPRRARMARRVTGTMVRQTTGATAWRTTPRSPPGA